MEDIFNECKKYLNYLSINKNIKNYNKMNLVEGTKIKPFYVFLLGENT